MTEPSLQDPGAAPQSRSRSLALALSLGIAGVFACLAAWATASPIGSTADERAHIAYAYGVASGQVIPGVTEELQRQELPPRKPGDPPGERWLTVVGIPPELTDYQKACYAFDWTQPANCEPGAADTEDERVGTTTYVTRYPPLYYGVIGGWFRMAVSMGLDGSATLLTARLLSALMVGGLIAASLNVLAVRLPFIPVSVLMLAAMTPTAFHLSASINPNGFEVAAAVLLAASVLAARLDARNQGTVSPRLQLSIVLATAVLVLSRPFSFIWAALILLALVAVPARGQWQWRRWLDRSTLTVHPATWVASALLVGIGALWFLVAAAARSTGQREGEWSTYPAASRAGSIVLKFGELVPQAVGTLGWADTRLPDLVILGWVVASAVVIAQWWTFARLTPPGVLGVVLPALAATTLVFAHSYWWGYGWQGRYLLPVSAAFFGLMSAGVAMTWAREPDRRWVLYTVVAALALVQAGAPVWYMWRYAYGAIVLDSRLPAAPWPIGEAEWTPTIGASGVLALSALALLGWTLAAVVNRRHERSLSKQDSVASS